MRAALLSIALLLPVASAAQAPPLPPLAREVADARVADSALRLPVTPWQAGDVQTILAEGDIRRQVWQVTSPGLTTHQLIAPIRSALEKDGYAILLDCAADECGGFEFRFATDALPPPEMYVDLGDYRYLSAQKSAPAGEAWRAVMVSATDARGFVQITAIDPPEKADASAAADSAGAEARPPALASVLDEEGHAVLWDLVFDTGAAALGPGPFASLGALAEWLRDHPGSRVALVGHTDTEGALPANIDLSRRRALAVRDRLIGAHGIAADRLLADGVGYLAPVASNATAAGRERNRRVEAVVVPNGS